MRTKILVQFLLFVLVLLPSQLWAATKEISEISFLSVNSAITPATYDYLNQNFNALPDSSLIVLRLNTPGGLVTTTKDIITLVGNKKRPFVVWITPEGASASSAGAIIASSAHFIFMSPGTNMGAATPVGLGEDMKESDGRKKAMNDLTALVRSLSSSRGRPSAPFEKMILSADSYTSSEALDLKIIDGIISSESDLMKAVEGKEFNLDGVPTSINLTGNIQVKHYEPSIGQKILEVLANPSTAYILFLIAVALIYFEFQAPGGFIAGAVGFCFLILAGIAFQVLPLDWGSMGLIIAGIFLLILEVFIVSYGILSIAGLIAFITGSLFLFHGEAGFISIQYSVIISSLLGVGSALGLIVWLLWKDRKKNPVKDFFLPIGSNGQVMTKLDPKHYQVKVRGEIWRGISEEELALNDQIEVESVDTNNLTVKIKKLVK